MGESLLELMGYGKKETEKVVTQAFKFDESIIPYLLSAEEASEVANLFNEHSKREIKSYSKQCDLSALAEKLVNQKVENHNVTTVAYFEVFDELITEKNFEQIKSWMLLQTAVNSSGYLNQEATETAATYNYDTNGVTRITRQGRYCS